MHRSAEIPIRIRRPKEEDDERDKFIVGSMKDKVMVPNTIGGEFKYPLSPERQKMFDKAINEMEKKLEKEEKRESGKEKQFEEERKLEIEDKAKNERAKIAESYYRKLNLLNSQHCGKLSKRNEEETQKEECIFTLEIN